MKLVLDGRFARALKSSQLACGDVIITCETVHYSLEMSRAHLP